MKHAYPFLVLAGWLLAPPTTTQAQVLPNAVDTKLHHRADAPRCGCHQPGYPNTPERTGPHPLFRWHGLTQTIQRWAGADGVQDVLTEGREYDFIGRVQSISLPVPANITGEPVLYPSCFYSGSAFYDDGNMYTEPVYEPSPRRR